MGTCRIAMHTCIIMVILIAFKLQGNVIYYTLQLISGAFEHSVLHVWEIYALENAVFYIAVYGPYKPYISTYM